MTEAGYRLSLDAEDDLGELYRRGYWQFGELQADKFYNKLHDTLELLAEFPYSGRDADFIFPGIRRIEFLPYVIFYAPRDYGAYIARIMHQSQVIRGQDLARAMESTIL
ncbi:type II toxin-antitoxin system RelE/ParE family toxin [Hahella sp. NBU794]|uniref:type II toxin-antitoxin system RelE/ParE family toxin n=1 Tax=Hahella sp. NBU794 TaxID=3422590 RepID=UPI003D6DEC38